MMMFPKDGSTGEEPLPDPSEEFLKENRNEG
jgi:hypothetical protein